MKGQLFSQTSDHLLQININLDLEIFRILPCILVLQIKVFFDKW